MQAQLRTQFGDADHLEHTVLDNGGKPYRVIVETAPSAPRELVVAIVCVTGDSGRKLGAVVRIDAPDAIWYGSGSYNKKQNVDDMDGPRQHYTGNTVLIVKGRTLTLAARHVSRFQLRGGERVTRYVSTVGNSAVPYGYIETTLGIHAVDDNNCQQGFLPWSEVPATLVRDCWDEVAPQPLTGFKRLM